MTRSLLRAVVLTSAFALFAAPATAQSTTDTAAGPIQTLDCYELHNPSYLEDQGANTFQTSGYCQTVCVAANKPVMATTGGSNCYCGDELPPASAKVDNSNCNSPCQGFNQQTCGGIGGFFQLYLSGLTGDVETAPDSASSASSTATSAPSSTSTEAAIVTKTVAPTAAPASSSSAISKSSGGPSKVGIAVGVVVGVIALAAIIGVVVFFMRRRRNRDIEEEHRRNAAIGTAKSDKSSLADQRLDPSIYSHARQSIGSIADERDFSRRILQVRNPDRDSRTSNLA
ncbi:Protein SLG1 [Exophiala xenobiotica]|uniref:Protein SLG1 n=1 Tax=Vermiconidia calcicola TaxID=1690605 RepID=A0AAV9Q1A6_9PEZI|nr:Stress-activated PKC1-MPK1 kinase pathway sensor [Exophiala xenobiotica]KAK5533342.1 Protein SLG1 [Vermiconidia calcicola]KAK5534296.1 Protein SLG1 [Chaetothyriales sp. CCFEE 6169]KAK5189326.1 Protein SLG1 [Exophiala xenobiotica]KAK5205799.1 Protein SLG1 [Exophiala xenobiotica]